MRRTRVSTRPRNNPPKTYTFKSSSSSPAASPSRSPPPPPPSSRRRASSPASPPPAAARDQDEEAFRTPSSARAAPRRVRNKKKTGGARRAPPASVGTYLDVEPVTTDTHLKGYAGPYDRGMRGQTLVATWYGPHAEDVRSMQGLLDRWMAWTVLPAKHVAAAAGGEDDEDEQALAGFAARERRSAEDTWRAFGSRSGGGTPQQRCVALEGDARRPFEQPRLGIRVVMGPVDDQRVWTMHPGDGFALTQSWLPYHEDASDAKLPSGWLLDAGGIVTAMDWCPGRAAAEQLLALAVVPHADQENYHYESEHQRPDFQMRGTVQVWALEGDVPVAAGLSRPSSRPPTLRRTICLDFGRVSRLRWCPVPDATLATHPSPVHYMAVLCGDGRVCIVANDERDDGSFDYVVDAEATLMLENEDGVKATAMAWATFNRLVVGYSDGSVALWSLCPCFVISRHPVHHSLVVDLATAYPSHPFLVASTPLGGVTKLVDLSRPTFETTEVQINAVSWQPNMLAYSRHLQGFYSVYPSANALNTMVAFLHQRFFPIVRRVFVGESYNSSLAVGRTHPFLLIGSTDGSLWSLNPQVELFSSRRGPTDRLRLFQHEHRSKQLFPADSPASARGASRFLHGFAMEKGRRPKGEVKPQPAKKQKRPRKSDAAAAAAEVIDDDDDDDDEEAAGVMDPTRGIVYEPLSRVTSVEWNPNRQFGCWAAAAMASGLVRIMDLGLDGAPG